MLRSEDLRPRPPIRDGALLGVVALGLAIGVGTLGAFGVLDRSLYDWIVSSSSSEPQDPRVRCVYVGDSYVELMKDEFGRWPWRDRTLHALAISALREHGARTVAVDILLAESAHDAEGSDRRLAEEIALLGPVVLGCLFDVSETSRWEDASERQFAAAALERCGGKFGVSAAGLSVQEGSAVLMPIEPLLDASPLVGHMNPAVDADGAIRRVPLFVRHRGDLYPSLSLRAVMEYLSVDHDGLAYDVEDGVVRLVPEDGPSIDIPVDAGGNVWLHFDRPLDEFEVFGYQDLPDLPDGRLDDALVVVGASVSAAQDRWATPRSLETPGFLIHAQLIENVLTGRFVTAIEPISEATLARGALQLAVLLLAAAAIGAGGACVRPGWGALVSSAAALGPIAVSALLLSAADTWVPPTMASIALFGAGSLGAARRRAVDRRARHALRRVYERYVSPQVMKTILENPARLTVGGARKELTIFFSDIRGFTAYAEGLEPEDLNDRLNEYFAAMTQIVHEHGGTLDKFIGDAVMVFFGDPLPQQDGALRAVRMAKEMQSCVTAMTARWEPRGVAGFEVGMGLATGYVTVGNFGSDAFADYTVIGNAANRASRLCSEASGGEALLDSRTFHALEGAVDCDDLGPRCLAGVREQVAVYRVRIGR